MQGGRKNAHKRESEIKQEEEKQHETIENE